MMSTLKDPALEPFVTRIGFACSLEPFTLEDTRNYIRFHLERAGARDRLFSDDDVKRLFQASQGTPRRVNQLAIHALNQTAVMGHGTITGDFLQDQLQAHIVLGRPYAERVADYIDLESRGAERRDEPDDDDIPF